MFNRENDPVREQERPDGEGNVAGVPVEEHDNYRDREAVEEDAAPEADTEDTAPRSNKTTAVKYVGRGGAYRDADGTKYKKGEPVEVSEEDAERLTSLRGSSLFVRADS